MDELRSYIGEGDESISSVIRIALKELLKRLKDEQEGNVKPKYNPFVTRLRDIEVKLEKEEKEKKEAEEKISETVKRLRRLAGERNEDNED